MKMFARIREYLEDRQSFVVVLIDEVESLTAARSGSVWLLKVLACFSKMIIAWTQKASKDEPSDAVRVVNSLLTQLGM